jgi:hypothetical protein
MKLSYLLSIILMLSFSAYGQQVKKKKNPNTLSGAWKETKRTNRMRQSIPYKDTITIEFSEGNKYFWQKLGGYGFKGSYKMDPKTLDLGMRFFEIVEKRPVKLSLKEDTIVHEFVPYKPTVPTTAPKPPRKEEVYKPVPDINLMVGRWSAYKKISSAKPGPINYEKMIKGIIINSQPVDGKLGTVLGMKDVNEAATWFVESYTAATQMLTCGGKEKRELQVLKCEGGELIIQDGDITYYFKQFNK